jgi:uncharacterized repeat protein (TIGR01451 family)
VFSRGIVTYTLTLKNLGFGDALNTVVTDALPVGSLFQTATAPCVEASGVVTCSLGSVAANDGAAGGLDELVITITAKAVKTSHKKTMSNQSSAASSNEAIGTEGDNTSNAVTTVNPCPDVNVDGMVNNTDLLQAALHLQDKGVSTGADLAAAVNAVSTLISVTNKDLLVLGAVAIDNEQMTITLLTEGSPDTADVTRAANGTAAKPHDLPARLARPTTDGNLDGLKGYTPNRDVNSDGTINNTDLLIIGLNLGTNCPS